MGLKFLPGNRKLFDYWSASSIEFMATGKNQLLFLLGKISYKKAYLKIF